ncbi:MAG TPA: MFS transporter [Pseudomonadales bacterium]
MTASTSGPRRLTIPVMAAFGFGQLGEALVTIGFTTFLLYFYNQVLGVSGTITGIALAISLFVDAVVDPIAGALSDRLRSRWGRRHPFILLSAIPLGGCFFLIFNPPAGLGEYELAAWLVVWTLATRIALTFFHVPHLALGAEMAHDYNQRSTMYSYNTFFSIVGQAIGVALAYALFFPTTEQFNPGLLNPAGYFQFSAAFGLVVLVAILVCVLGTWREIPYLPNTGRSHERFSLMNVVRETSGVFGNRSFRALFFGLSLATIMLSAEGVLTPYMNVHFWGLTTEQISTIPAFSMVGLILGFMITPALTKWLDKKKTLMYCAMIAVVNSCFLVGLRLLDVSWFPANGSPLVLPLIFGMSFIGALLAPPIFGSLNAMFADIVDEHELDTGHRREGIIFAARSFLIKAISSVGVIIGGWVIDWIGFPRGARAGTVPEDVLWDLGLYQAPLPSIFVFLSVILYSGYRLDRKRHAEIVAALNQRRAAASATELPLEVHARSA